jgi:hypothetical protein
MGAASRNGLLNYHRALAQLKLSEECGGTCTVPVCVGRCPAPRRCERPRLLLPPPPAHSPHYIRMTLKIWRKSVENPGCLCRIRLFPYRIPDSQLTRSRICIKEFKYFYPKKLILSSQIQDLGCSSRIRIFPSRIRILR